MRQQIRHGSAVRNDKQCFVYPKLISIKASARENGEVILASKYLRSIGWRSSGKLIGRQQARMGRKFWPCNLSSHCAGRHAHLRIIPNALGLAHVAARHHIELVVLLAEPHGSRDCCSGLAKRGERNIFLVANLRRNLSRHRLILGLQTMKILAETGRSLSLLVPICARWIAPVLPSVLQA